LPFPLTHQTYFALQASCTGAYCSGAPEPLLAELKRCGPGAQGRIPFHCSLQCVILPLSTVLPLGLLTFAMQAKPSARVSKGMVRFANTQEVLTAPSGSMPLAQLQDSASFKDSSVRHRAQNGLDALMQGNKRFLAVRASLTVGPIPLHFLAGTLTLSVAVSIFCCGNQACATPVIRVRNTCNQACATPVIRLAQHL
jgi:hypothetical protein